MVPSTAGKGGKEIVKLWTESCARTGYRGDGNAGTRSTHQQALLPHSLLIHSKMPYSPLLCQNVKSAFALPFVALPKISKKLLTGGRDQHGTSSIWGPIPTRQII